MVADSLVLADSEVDSLVVSTLADVVSDSEVLDSGSVVVPVTYVCAHRIEKLAGSKYWGKGNNSR